MAEKEPKSITNLAKNAEHVPLSTFKLPSPSARYCAPSPSHKDKISAIPLLRGHYRCHDARPEAEMSDIGDECYGHGRRG